MQRVAMLERSVKSASGSRAGCTSTSPTASQPRAVWRAHERRDCGAGREHPHPRQEPAVGRAPIRTAPDRLGHLTPAVQRLSLRCSTAASRPSIPNSNGSCGSTAGRRKLNLDAVDLPFEANRWPSDVRMLWGPARAVVRCSELYNGCERHDATCTGPLSSPSSIASILARGNHVSNDVSYPALQSTPTAARQ